jgi:hypothetical protein
VLIGDQLNIPLEQDEELDGVVEVRYLPRYDGSLTVSNTRDGFPSQSMGCLKRFDSAKVKTLFLNQ